jgi:hypothetical protein
MNTGEEEEEETTGQHRKRELETYGDDLNHSPGCKKQKLKERSMDSLQEGISFAQLPVDLIQYIFGFDNHLILYADDLQSDTFKIGNYFGRYKSDGKVHLWNVVFCVDEELDLFNPNFLLIVKHALVLCFEVYVSKLAEFVARIDELAPQLIQFEIAYVMSEPNLAQVLLNSSAKCIKKGLKELQIELSCCYDSNSPKEIGKPILAFQYLKELTLDFSKIPKAYHIYAISIVDQLKDLVFLELGDAHFSRNTLKTFLEKVCVKKVRLSDIKIDDSIHMVLDGIEKNQIISCLELRHKDFYLYEACEIARLQMNPRLKSVALSIHVIQAMELLTILSANTVIQHLQLNSNELLSDQLLSLRKMKQLKRLYLHFIDVDLQCLIDLIRALDLQILVLWGERRLIIDGELMAEFINACVEKKIEVIYTEYSPECDTVPTKMIYC